MKSTPDLSTVEDVKNGWNETSLSEGPHVLNYSGAVFIVRIVKVYENS